jgi:uncharacterized damage-inducible protein DinB
MKAARPSEADSMTEETTMTGTSDAERSALLQYLQAQRQHVLGILEGLDEEALRRSVLPSGWTTIGLVNHLSVDVERFWFRAVVGGEPEAVDGVLSTTADGWQVDEAIPAAEVLATYRREIELADAILSKASVEAKPAWWSEELFGGWHLDTVREVLLHVIAETACHAGHLDAARELLDGRLWLVLD